MAGRKKTRAGLPLLRGTFRCHSSFENLTNVLAKLVGERRRTLACLPLTRWHARADVAQAERPELFQKKLAVCAVVYDFRVETETEAKEDKRQSLLELIDFVNVKKSITEPMYKDTIEMVRAPPAPPPI